MMKRSNYDHAMVSWCTVEFRLIVNPSTSDQTTENFEKIAS